MNKIIKLSESQAKQFINEDFPFAYMGTESSDVNHGDTISVEGPHKIDSPDIDIEPAPSDKVDDALCNTSWWRTGHGFGGNYLGYKGIRK